MLRKFKKIEKVIIATTGDNYTTYDCSNHGVFGLIKSSDNGKCPYNADCNVSKIENITELKDKFRKELGFNGD